jgi:hypothetical protein
MPTHPPLASDDAGDSGRGGGGSNSRKTPPFGGFLPGSTNSLICIPSSLF